MINFRNKIGRSEKMRSKRSGFTLIELMISMFIFVIFLSVVTSSYVSIVRSQRQENEVRKMYAEVRTFIQVINQEIKLNEVDYDCYAADFENAGNCPLASGSLNTGKTNLLYLSNKNGLEKTIITFDSENSTVKMRKIYLNNRSWEPQEEQVLFSPAVKISNLDFWVFPNVNPYSNESSVYLNPKTQFQPKVTVFLSAVNGKSTLPDFSMDFQTTISSRVYNR